MPMRLLTSSLKSIINAFLNGQLAPQGEGKGEGYRYALSDNSTVGRVNFGAKKANTAEFFKTPLCDVSIKL